MKYIYYIFYICIDCDAGISFLTNDIKVQTIKVKNNFINIKKWLFKIIIKLFSN
jgi:hypothetical protein